MRIKINLKSVLFYIAYALACVALNSVVSGIPFSFGLCFSMLICGTNIVATPILFVLSSIISLDWITVLLSLFEGAFSAIITLLYRRTRKKIRAEAAAYVLIALAPYIAFAQWTGIETLQFTSNHYVMKGIAALAVLTFTFFAFRGVHSLIYRLFRCKLRADELLCIAVLFAVTGTGVRNLVGEYAYICIGAGIVAFAARLYRSPKAIIVAVVTAAPAAIVQLNLAHVTAFVLLSLFALLFCELYSGAPSFACVAGGALYLFTVNLYYSGATAAVLYSLLLVACCIAAALPPEKKVAALRDMLEVKRALPRTEEEIYKEFVAERLYRMSEVFREIEGAFNALDDGPDDKSMKKRMLEEVKEGMCADCKRKSVCADTKVYRGFYSLVEAGCIKGKVSLVDLTPDITQNCIDATALIERVNRLLYEYRKATLEAENARSGRRLLAGQARGVAEVLKCRATEFCRTGEDFSAQEKKLKNELVSSGISCPELTIRGDGASEILAAVIDCKNPAPVKNCIERTLGGKVMLKDKQATDARKCVYVFVRPPKYDAAFGVAFKIKDGESVSGDTHSVIKINEHAFLMALSDGMGSGEYARKVSATAISLIEAFYRSEMPTDIVLDTINKLLCFNRDERFTCIDAAAIDLNTLTASFIKIGAPVAMIVRKGEIKILESHSLPLGILDNLHPSTTKEQLKKDDIVVFMSDGVTSAFGNITELYDYVQTLKPLNPQSLAEKILKAAGERVLGVPDDMTVLCVRIFQK